MTSLSALHTDLYQLTMAQGYWKLGIHQRLAVFELFFRQAPFGGAYAIACGLETVIDCLTNYHFTAEDLSYLKQLRNPQAEDLPLFEAEFLQVLSQLKLSIDMDSIEEGAVVFPKQPLLRITGPLWQCQLLETLVLNLINFPTLIATKASRVCKAAADNNVIEFGLRRSQGPDGGLTASRACYVGGACASSNVLAGKRFGIPVIGTHAHSWIMVFEDELTAFLNYAKVMPNNCVLLVDTYQTIEGVKHAIEVGLKLKQQGHALLGIRLDSGDLATLSVQARDLLDAAGLTDTKIIGSSDLDEYAIVKLKERGCKIDTWGVGTHMVTGYEQPALGGVYKLVALQDENEQWQYRVKYSDDPEKRSMPGVHAIRRYEHQDHYIKDIVYDCFSLDSPREDDAKFEIKELLKPLMRQGNVIYALPTLPEIQKRCQEDLKKFDKGVTELIPTQQYPVEFLTPKIPNQENNDAKH